MSDYPNIPYMDAVEAAVSAAGLSASEVEYGSSHGGEILDGHWMWTAEHPAVDAEEYPHGVQLLWDERTGWVYAGRDEGGVMETPLIDLPVADLADPAAIVAVLPEVLAGRTEWPPSVTWDMTEWPDAGALRAYLDEEA